MSTPETPSTVTDEQWQSLQDRARKANPQLEDTFSAESVRRARAGAEQFRKRAQS